MFKKGQRVRFKTQEEFIKEFGEEWMDEINLRWNEHMNLLFGTEATIESITEFGDIELTDFSAVGDTSWSYSTDMIVEVDKSIPFPREVYVSDTSVERALEEKEKRICLGEFLGQYVCVTLGDEEKYKNGEDYDITAWRYIAEIEEEKTIQIQTIDGQTLKITKEKAIELGFNIK